MEVYSSQYNKLYFSSFLEGEDSHSAICGSSVCPPYSKCESGDICVCTQCSNDGKKVCGSDGKTYKDFCELQKIACESNTTLNMTRKGSCQGRFTLLHFPSLLRNIFWGEGSGNKNSKFDHDPIKEQEALTTRKTRKYWLENEILHPIPIGTFYRL